MNKYERLNQERKLTDRRRRVAVYCRVSTDHEDQANSFESQQRYFRQYIERNPDWDLFEVFADEGISGTSTKKRKEFNRMIACAKNGDFDLIVTKEISRFARNTLDSIYYTRELKKHGVGVIFMNDNINTLDSDAELRLAILSSIAQEESRKTSERVKWGQRRRMEQGVVFGRSMLGYDVRGGKMYINAEGARIVRLIFQKFVNENKGAYVIARELHEEGIMPLRSKNWNDRVILRLLRNEKYCGDLVQKKTYTPDFLSHEKKYNKGQEEFVIIRNHHEPIISREQFEAAGRILDDRALSTEGQSRFSKRYLLSGKIKCGKCGASYVARCDRRKTNKEYKLWRCYQAARYGKPRPDKEGKQHGCSGESIRNEDAVHLLHLVCQSLHMEKSTVIHHLTQTVQSVISADAAGDDLQALAEEAAAYEMKRAKLIDLYAGGEIRRDEFTALSAQYDRAIARVRSRTERIGHKQNMTENSRERMAEIRKTIDEIVRGIRYEDPFYADILDKIVVNDREHMDVFLKRLPHKWSYVAEKAAEKTNPPCGGIISASVPMSVSSAMVSRQGME